jgi:hypothetical protein
MFDWSLGYRSGKYLGIMKPGRGFQTLAWLGKGIEVLCGSGTPRLELGFVSLYQKS